jgi:hypothetical protein
MKDHLKQKLFIKTLSIVLLTIIINGCSESNETSKSSKAEQMIQTEKDTTNNENIAGKNDEIAVTPPPFSDGIFPCSDCHNYIKPNPVRRKLTDMHEEISDIFNHDSQNRWCLDCHDLNNRDSLRLASGKLLDFKESYKLCGQCHGDKLRDWKVGVHGKRTGDWNGRKEYYLCVNCHNPHSPKFPPIKPEPPPVREDELNK